MKLFSAFFVLVAIAAAQPQPPYKPTPDELQQIKSKADELDTLIRAAKVKRPDPSLLADVEVYEKAARWILEFPEEFFNQTYVTQTLSVLDEGASRARQLAAGEAPWVAEKGRTLRGYRSEV